MATTYPLNITVTKLVNVWWNELRTEQAREEALEKHGLKRGIIEKMLKDAEDPALMRIYSTQMSGLNAAGIDLDAAWVCMAKKAAMDAEDLNEDPLPDVTTRTDVITRLTPWYDRIGAENLRQVLGVNLHNYFKGSREELPQLPSLQQIVHFLVIAPKKYAFVQTTLDFIIVQNRLEIAPDFTRVVDYDSCIEWMEETLGRTLLTNAKLFSPSKGTLQRWLDKKSVPSRGKIKEYFRIVREHKPEWLELDPIPEGKTIEDVLTKAHLLKPTDTLLAPKTNKKRKRRRKSAGKTNGFKEKEPASEDVPKDTEEVSEPEIIEDQGAEPSPDEPTIDLDPDAEDDEPETEEQTTSPEPVDEPELIEEETLAEEEPLLPELDLPDVPANDPLEMVSDGFAKVGEGLKQILGQFAALQQIAEDAKVVATAANQSAETAAVAATNARFDAQRAAKEAEDAAEVAMESAEAVEAMTKEQPAPEAPILPPADDLFTGSKDIGEELRGVRFNLTARSFKPIEDRMTEEEFDDTLDLLAELDRRLALLASGPTNVKDAFIDRAADALLRHFNQALVLNLHTDAAVQMIQLQLETWGWVPEEDG